MEIQYLRAFHIIFIVTWLAGIYFLGRMLIYFDQAKNRPDVEKNAIQEVVSKGATRVWYIIVLPSMIIKVPGWRKCSMDKISADIGNLLSDLVDIPLISPSILY